MYTYQSSLWGGADFSPADEAGLLDLVSGLNLAVAEKASRELTDRLDGYRGGRAGAQDHTE